MMPFRVQRRREKGWRMPPNTVYVGRPSIWGNPFNVEDLSRAGDDLIDYYRWWLDGELAADWHRWKRGNAARERLSELRDKNLACWCPLDRACHADVLLELANQ